MVHRTVIKVNLVTCGSTVFRNIYAMFRRQFPRMKFTTSISSSSIPKLCLSIFEMDRDGIFVDTRNAVNVNNVPPLIFLVRAVKMIRKSEGTKSKINVF